MARLHLLFFFVAAGLLLASECTAARPAPSKDAAAFLNTTAAAPMPLGNGRFNGTLYSNDPNYPKDHIHNVFCNDGDSWQQCMEGVLGALSEFPYCNKHCNVIVYRIAFGFKRAEMPSPMYTDQVYLEGQLYIYYLFHGPAYFRTKNWGGWDNWAFTGNFQHNTGSGEVRFFPY